MRILIVLSLYFFINISIDAQAELVHEFFPGSDGTTVYTDFTGTFNQETSVKLANDIIIFSAKGEFGQELYKIENGGLFLLKDLMTGAEGSDPQFLTLFEGVVYFVAEGDQGARIYKTDGTEEGTQIAFELGDEDTGWSDFSILLVGRDGRLYFEYESIIYTYRNDILSITNPLNPINVDRTFNANDYGWALYKEGVVVFDLIDGVLYLLSIIENEVAELVEIPYDGGFDDQLALESFEGGVFFSIDSFDDDVQGDYVFEESTGLLTKIFGGGNLRSDYLGDNECVISGLNGGTYLFNSDHPKGLEIHDNNQQTVAGGVWERDRLGAGLLFLGDGGVFEDTEVFFIERNSSIATLVHITDNMSAMKTDGSFTFYFGESELGDKFDDEDLFAFDHTTKEVSPIKTLFDAPFNSNITPLGVIDQDLYFFGKLDNNVGLELYKIDIGFSTATEDVEDLEVISLTKKGEGQYVIDYDSNGSINVEIRSIDGRLLEKSAITANIQFEIRQKGIILVIVEVDGRAKTFKVFN